MKFLLLVYIFTSTLHTTTGGPTISEFKSMNSCNAAAKIVMSEYVSMVNEGGLLTDRIATNYVIRMKCIQVEE